LAKGRLVSFFRRIHDQFTLQILIPDRQVGWVPYALKQGQELVQSYDVVISSSDPASSHLVGLFLREWFRRPWIVDFGDPFVFDPEYNFPAWRRWVNTEIQKQILRRADEVIVTTEETKEIFLQGFPFLNHTHVHVIPGGFDQREFEEVMPSISDKFRIVYTGAFHKNIRNPRIFFEALKLIKESRERLFLEVLIAGDVNVEHVDYVQKEGLGEIVVFLGLRPHREVIALQKGASVLLLLGNRGGLQLPSKVFEYIGAKRPILVVQGDEHDIAANMIRNIGRGVIVENNPRMIADSIKQLYEQWEQGCLDHVYRLEPLQEFSWESRVERLEQVILGALRQREWYKWARP